MKKFSKLDFRTFSSRGYRLTPIELKDSVPFEVKRVYYITDFNSGSETGQHCHKTEEEIFVQVKGSSLVIIDRGEGLEEIKMAGPSEAIYVPNYVWHGFKDASADCVILALSSTNYTPSREDYIEDYGEFKKASPYYKN